jgi:type IV pilus biogenesis protein CpaD/CtpE
MTKPIFPFAILSALALASLAGCTSLQSVSVTQIPADRSRPLHAQVSNTALLGIHFDNDFIEPLTANLMRQCPQGRVTGILTKQESSVYVIIQVRRVVATGYCVYDPPPAQPSEATAMQEMH